MSRRAVRRCNRLHARAERIRQRGKRIDALSAKVRKVDELMDGSEISPLLARLSLRRLQAEAEELDPPETPVRDLRREVDTLRRKLGD